YLELPPDFYPVLPGQSDPEAYRKAMGQRKQPAQIQSGGRRLVNMNQATRSSQTAGASPSAQPPKDFIPSDPSMVRVGVKVEHPRFGIGEVHQLEGTGSNIKATVLFPIGTKQLLLKFAKLRVVES
ncbi:MAG: hypothetical protein U9R49_08070, partial [Bacteroidota bacterium]|nr:hypothetical protein [Bacteroidota bacterium]